MVYFWSQSWFVSVIRYTVSQKIASTFKLSVTFVKS